MTEVSTALRLEDCIAPENKHWHDITKQNGKYCSFLE